MHDTDGCFSFPLIAFISYWVKRNNACDLAAPAVNRIFRSVRGS